MTQNILPTVIIHLERNLSRLPYIDSLRTYFPHGAVFPAVDGREIFFDVTDQVNICWRQYTFLHLPNSRLWSVDWENEDMLGSNTQSNLKNDTQNTKNEVKAYTMTGRVGTPIQMGYGEAGCAISHRLLWEEQVKANIPLVLYLEDDAVLKNLDELRNLLLNLPALETWDTYILNHIKLPESLFRQKNISSSYLLTLSGATKLCKCFTKEDIPMINLPANDSISLLTRHKVLRTLFPSNQIFATADCPSSMWVDKDDWKYTMWNKPKKQPLIVELGDWTGLGNQMFQYSAVKALSLETGRPIQIVPKHKYYMNLFPYFVNHWISDTLPVGTQTWEEKSFRHDPSIGDIGDKAPSVVKGFLQNPQYIKGWEQVIRQIFKFPPKTITNVNSIITQLREKVCTKETKLVGIHLRLADFRVETERDTFVYNIPTIEYIQESIKYQEEKVPSVLFIIVSNDLQLARTKFTDLKSRLPIVWISAGLLDDMALLSLCDHHILSPGTYSYWGWWLSSQRGNTTIFQPMFNVKTSRQGINDEIDFVGKDWKQWRDGKWIN